MITTEGLVTTVKFGTTEKASISVNARRGFLILQQLAAEKKIGDHLDDDEIQELPKIEMEFFDIKSVDVLIGALNVIKKNYAAPAPKATRRVMVTGASYYTYEQLQILSQAC